MPPPSPVRPSPPVGGAQRAAATAGLRARRLLSLGDQLEGLAALLAPRIELVGFEPGVPRLLRALLVAPEPARAPELVVRLDEIRSELEGLLEERLRVLVHVALQ